MNEKFWCNRRVCVTGATGFLGTHLCNELRSLGATVVPVSRQSGYDLRSQEASQYFFYAHPDAKNLDIVFHLAGHVGGIGENMICPADMFYDNMMMGLNVIDCCAELKVRKLIFTSSTCVYPCFTPIPFNERNIWNGYPEETNAAYGIAKRALHTALDAYRTQYNLHGICLVPTNSFGPGMSFDLDRSHTIPAIIRKVLEAKASGLERIEAWGTGKPTRDFIYVSDLVDAMILAAERYDDAEPLNIGSGQEMSILGVVNLICKILDFHGEVVWNGDKPDGQPRRCLNISRAKHYLNWEPKINLEEGIRLTAEWYKEQIQ